MTDDRFGLLVDLHRSGRRQGPGGDDATRLALKLAGLDMADGLVIADIGCGTGASTLALAEALNAYITGVDLTQSFLDELDLAVEREGLGGRIKTVAASMDALPFEDQSLDVIWSEGAIYIMGFENGIRNWRRYLKPGGILAVSELTWLTERRPPELEQHWQEEYAEVAPPSAKLAVLEKGGYSPIGYFPLPQSCWLDNYYRPMQSRFESFLERHGHSDMACAMVEAEKAEIALYVQYANYFGYGFYVARKI